MTGPVPDELQRTLTKMVEANAELRGTVAEAHAARKDLLTEFKSELDTIREIIHAEIEGAVAALQRDVRARMEAAADAAIEGIVADWRGKLGL